MIDDRNEAVLYRFRCLLAQFALLPRCDILLARHVSIHAYTCTSKWGRVQLIGR